MVVVLLRSRKRRRRESSEMSTEVGWNLLELVQVHPLQGSSLSSSCRIVPLKLTEVMRGKVKRRRERVSQSSGAGFGFNQLSRATFDARIGWRILTHCHIVEVMKTEIRKSFAKSRNSGEYKSVYSCKSYECNDDIAKSLA